MSDFHPVTDLKLIALLEAAVTPLLDGPWHLRVEELARRSWAAVPVEKGRHIEPDAAEPLAAALQQQTSGPCYAVATEPTGQQPRCYLVGTSAEALLSFSHECAGLNFILVPRELGFALLFTSEDYNVYAGPRQFLEAVVAQPLKEARSAFEQYADDPWWEGRLLQVHERYAALD